jgi:hypothetical protein
MFNSGRTLRKKRKFEKWVNFCQVENSNSDMIHESEAKSKIQVCIQLEVIEKRKNQPPYPTSHHTQTPSHKVNQPCQILLEDTYKMTRLDSSSLSLLSIPNTNFLSLDPCIYAMQTLNSCIQNLALL